MPKIILKLIALVVLCNLSYNSLAQKQTMSLKSTAVSTDSSHAAICSSNNYLPINSPRGTFLNLVSQISDKRIIFADYASINGGISVYDGNNWSYWNSDNFLNSNSIYSFYTDKKGNTWIGTDPGLNFINGKNWKKYSFSGTKYDISSICEDKKGVVWAFYVGSAYASFTVDTINNLLKQTNTPFDDAVTSSTRDKDENMWVATRNGVYKYDGNVWTRYTTKNGLNNNYVTSIKPINDTIYCFSGTMGDSVKKFDGNKFITIKTPSSNSIGFKNIIEDSKHNIWILNQGGEVYKYSHGNWIQVPFWNVGMYAISEIFMDKDDNIWATSQGIKVAKISDGNIELVTTSLDKGIGFMDPRILFVDKNENLWTIPSWSNGVSKFDGKKWTYYEDLIISRYFTSIAQDKAGNIYLGGQYISKFDGTNWTFLWSGALSSYSFINTIMFDKNDNMWFGCSNKIVKYDGINAIEFGEQEGVFQYPKKMLQDKDGNIWVIYYNVNQVQKFDGLSWTTFTLPAKDGCNDAIADSLGNVWFATSNYGLVKYNKSLGMKLYNTLNSDIPFDNLLSISSDAQNNIWFVSDGPQGLGYYNQTDNVFSISSIESFKNFKTRSGIAIDKNNNIYMGSYGSGLLKLSYQILLPEITKSDIACVGADNGIINIFPNKDLAYTYSISGSPFVKDTTFSNLKGGNYTIIGKKGQCYTSPKPLTITQPAGKFDVIKKDATCYGLTDGSISILTDGLGSVSYTWPTGKDTSAIKNIGKGTYKVTVKYGTCEFDRSFDIAEPKKILLTGNQLNACGYKGKIDISLSNGVEPYSIKWSNGDTTLSLKNLLVGSYMVSIKDANNCNTKDSTFIIKSFDPIPKSSIIGISKAYICSSNLSISTINDFTTYAWYKDNSLLTNSTKSILATETGSYKVAVVDQNNCLAFDSIKAIKRNTYATPQICLVTVDETTSKNKIIWNKFAADSSVIINVLKETNQSGKYSNIGKIPAYNSGIFTDDNSDPVTLASRYKLNLTDECKIDSDTGTIHKTIHLTSNMGTHGEVNLIWSGYEGFTFDSYNIYRGTSKDNLTLLTTIQSNLNSYTDGNPPVSDKLYYQLEVISPSECNPNTLKAGIISSKSNLINRNFTAVTAINSTDGLKVFPIPVDDVINVTFDNLNGETLKVKLCDITGKVLRLETTTKSSSTMERGNLKGGLYFIEIEGKTGTNRIKITLK